MQQAAAAIANQTPLFNAFTWCQAGSIKRAWPTLTLWPVYPDGVMEVLAPYILAVSSRMYWPIELPVQE
jgi:hypothetical protein